MKPSTSHIRRSERLAKKEKRSFTRTTRRSTSQRSTANAAEKNIYYCPESPEAGDILSKLERNIGEDAHYYECLLCEDVGRLLCCQKCPGTYHLECLGLRSIPKGDWLCPTCSDNAAGSSEESFLKDLGTKKPLLFKKKKAASTSSQRE